MEYILNYPFLTYCIIMYLIDIIFMLDFVLFQKNRRVELIKEYNYFFSHRTIILVMVIACIINFMFAPVSMPIFILRKLYNNFKGDYES